MYVYTVYICFLLPTCQPNHCETRHRYHSHWHDVECVSECEELQFASGWVDTTQPLLHKDGVLREGKGFTSNLLEDRTT